MSSSDGVGGSRVRRLFEQARNADSIGEVLYLSIAATFLGIGTAVASGVIALGDLIIVPVQEVTAAIGGIVDGFFGSIGLILQAGGLSTALAVGPGGLFGGITGFVVAVAVVGAVAYLAIAITSEEPTTNFFPLIGTGIDVPTPGLTDAEEEEEG